MKVFNRNYKRLKVSYKYTWSFSQKQQSNLVHTTLSLTCHETEALTIVLKNNVIHNYSGLRTKIQTNTVSAIDRQGQRL